MALSPVATHLETFLQRKRSSTARGYRSTILALETYLKARGVSLPDVASHHVEAWLRSRKAIDNSKVVMWQRLSTFCKYLVRKGTLAIDPTADGCPVQAEQGQPRYLEKEEVRRILAAAQAISPTAWMICRLLYASGCRRDELRCLALDRIKRTTDNRFALVVKGKGGKTRVVTLNQATSSALASHMRVVKGRGHIFLFQSNNGTRPMCASVFYGLVKRACADAGLPRASPHFLRHAHASHALAGGASQQQVRSALGHASIHTTSRYLHTSATGKTASDFL